MGGQWPSRLLKIDNDKSLVQVKFEFVTVEMVGEAFEQAVKDQK